MKFAVFVGEIARPFAIIWSSLTGGIAAIIMATRVSDGTDGALLMGAVGLVVTGVYGFKAVETWKATQSQADVKIAEASK